MIKLYDYFRSGAAYRTRIALNLKNLDYEQIPVNLVRDGGEQFKPDYAALNQQMLVPTLIDGDITITQSMAIFEHLNETYPQPPLLPSDAAGRARVRSLAFLIACDVHPLNNLSVRLYLVDKMGVTEENRKVWIEHWIHRAFTAYEKHLVGSPQTGAYSHGDQPTLADACLIPQIANARLNKCDLSDFPGILKIEEICQAHPAFEKALPDNQPDAE